MTKKSALARLLAVSAVAATSVVGVSTSAQAIDCTQYGPNVDPGYLYTSGPYHRGPAGECATLPGHSGKAYIQCSKFNKYGNLWYFVRDASDNTVGWVWSGNVSRVVNSNHKKC
ncbi:hypothetical protein H9L10_11720 [Phycicoccus endophyticus]|uniref:SH3 domain-containing protein n=1 Tax=Phycicoccus endophyticus TaxID=1690220 RepID=A0A7G9R006_9MICO|nr:hypothetical protein [Phycicoccus endophyticus]NHI20791.1 hypothetical protein [Phycicoccus endophyticus]QNN48931.1 hypothetical protein H9L10_11720 [Phycicoccus endophyticus]GGL43965.1 hypothetical protein GCM10012283_28210 [Phycicoccus endophyticus]